MAVPERAGSDPASVKQPQPAAEVLPAASAGRVERRIAPVVGVQPRECRPREIAAFLSRAPAHARVAQLAGLARLPCEVAPAMPSVVALWV